MNASDDQVLVHRHPRGHQPPARPCPGPVPPRPSRRRSKVVQDDLLLTATGSAHGMSLCAVPHVMRAIVDPRRWSVDLEQVIRCSVLGNCSSTTSRPKYSRKSATTRNVILDFSPSPSPRLYKLMTRAATQHNIHGWLRTGHRMSTRTGFEPAAFDSGGRLRRGTASEILYTSRSWYLNDLRNRCEELGRERSPSRFGGNPEMQTL